MEEASNVRPSRLQKTLLDLAYSPIKLRVAITVAMLGVWYVAVAMPWSEEIDSTTRLVARERTRLDTAKQVEKLRKQVGKFQERIPKDSDSSEWLTYIVSGTRKYSLKVTTLNTNDRKELGPFKAVVVRMEVEGTFREIDGFLRWVETNQRLLRVDSLKVSPGKQGGERGQLKADLVILGVIA